MKRKASVVVAPLSESESDEQDPVIRPAAMILKNVLFGVVTENQQQKLVENSQDEEDGALTPFYLVYVVDDLMKKITGVQDEDRPKYPRKPRTAYNWFTSDKKQQTEGISSKQIAELWKSANRQTYEERADEDKVRYERDKAAYEAENGPIPKRKPRSDKIRKRALQSALEHIAKPMLEIADRDPESLRLHLIASSTYYLEGQPTMSVFNGDDIYMWLMNALLKVQYGGSADCYVRLALTITEGLRLRSLPRKKRKKRRKKSRKVSE